MNTLTLIMAVIVMAFIILILLECKRILPSISDSWYELKGWKKHLFTLFCWSLGFLMFFQTDSSTAFFFLSGAGLCFTGAASMFKERMTKAVHYIGAGLSILMAFMAIIFERHNIDPLLFFGLSMLFIYDIKNRIWWIEVSACICILYGLI
jgi:hypothetical protein